MQSLDPNVRLILGLGNPGREYALTYHNAGSLFVEHLADIQDASPFRERPQFAYTRFGRYILATSRMFMNESGSAARAALSFFKLQPHALCIAHDEGDLLLGSFKYSVGRGAAGHNGVRSVIAAIGTPAFARVRLGIRSRPGKTGSFVLRPMSRTDREKLYSAFASASTMFTVKDTP